MELRKRILLLILSLFLLCSPLFASFTSQATYYGTKQDKYAGRITASGQAMDPLGYSTAHRTLPFGTILRVLRIDTGAVVRVIVTDRGPYPKKGIKRDLDLSWAAARDLQMLRRGVVLVKYTILGYSKDYSLFKIRKRDLVLRSLNVQE